MSYDKSAVAQAFDSAASTYACHSQLQTRVARHLLLGANLTGRVLDLGCGPGTQIDSALKTQGQWIGLDLSHAMLQQARPNKAYVVQGDAESLPLQSQSLDALVSSMALQWCDVERSCSELGRVVSSGGRLYLAVVVQGSLSELQSSDCQSGFSVNRFAPAKAWLSQLTQAGFEVNLESRAETAHFDSVKTLLNSLRGVGANHSQQRSPGLRGKTWWREVQAHLEAQRCEHGLPLTYQIAYFRGLKL
ncbi:methyltransferase domain-containing protein [Paraferrimonas sedimenticola]|uniref:Malonyl-[acyl-carrier protein] O-methyltransferase n=1 Tax=Paraferrimonas sedimenticola TaxID=375674 RepID=A0AA37RWU2_9GAMM|nr:methyltransferase domain-containing protein [Paraferrimonas sedimenticola]GLP96660.1 malonyl-[acyl-carrier protein] O-methyltransferase [Paraferrimonas sedimenticola]